MRKLYKTQLYKEKPLGFFMAKSTRHRDDINVAFNARDDFFRDIFDSVQTGLLIIDPDTHSILDANAAALAMIGDDKKQVIGSICHKYICPAEKGHCPITDLHQTVDRSDRILLRAGGAPVPVIKSVGYISIAGRRCLMENFIDNTEHKKTETAVRENERKIRAIFDQTFQFIGILTPDGILTEANRSALKFSGIDESAAIGKPFWETPWWTHSPELQEQLRQAIASAAKGEFIRFEATHPATDGTLHYVDFSLKPVMDDQGNVIYLIPEGRDITDRKQIEDELHRKNEDLYAAYEQLTATEEELRQNYNELARKEQELIESEHKIRAVFDQTFQFIGLLSTDGFLLDTNRSAMNSGAPDVTQLLNRPFWEMPWWSHSPELQERIHSAVRSAALGTFVRFEALRIADSGTSLYFDVSIKPVKDEKGTIIFLIAESRDITDLKMTTQALLESENMYRAIFGNTGTAMALIEENTVISLINAEFEKMSGYTKEEVEGRKTWTQFVVREDLERMLTQHRLRRQQTGKALAHYEFRLVTKSGDMRNIFLSIDIIPGTKKSVASLMDVTENRKMTEELSGSLAEKEVLLREIHHRVKNNLQIIISLLNLQSRHISDKKVLAAIQESQNRVRAMALVHEKIYQSEHISEIDITEYISFLAKYLFDFYGTDKRSIKLVLEGECIKVGINTAVPLGLIINELISNSLKHAFPGGCAGKIMIFTEKNDDGIVIRVKDNGVGIPEHVDPCNTESLGLMLIQSLSEQLGATISLDRKCGTSYTITIPRDHIR
jgi:PAS domain S-box-containing protein